MDNKKDLKVKQTNMPIHIWNGDMDKFVQHFKSFPMRVEGIEEALMRKWTLQSNHGEVEHVKIMNMIWDKWGDPDADLYRKLIKSRPYPNYDSSVGRCVLKIEEKWNFNHPKWEEKDSAFYFARLVFSNRHEKIQEGIDNGWKIPFGYLNSRYINIL